MRVCILSDCRAAVISEQQVRCSPASGNAKTIHTKRNWLPTVPPTDAAASCPPYCEGIASAAGIFHP